MPKHDPGEYEAVITAQGHGQSAVKQTPYWRITIQPASRRGPDGRPRPCPQGEREIRFHVPAGNTSILEGALRKLGLTDDQIDPASNTYADLTGRRITVRCVHKPFGGEMREEWSLAPPAGVATSAAATIAARLAARRAAPPPPPPPADPPEDPPAPPAA